MDRVTRGRRTTSHALPVVAVAGKGIDPAELGFRLRRTDWGQGLASEGASALVNWGFGSNGYDKIVSGTMAVNHGSRRVMEKIGMRYARTAACEGDPFPGTEHGDVWYALTRSEWRRLP